MQKVNNNYYSVSDEATVTATTGTTTATYISIEESLRLKGYELMLHIVKSGCPALYS